MVTQRSRSGMFFSLAGWALVLLLLTTPGWAQNSVSQQEVDLTTYYNVNGINTDGTATSNGGVDNDGYAYSQTAIQTACAGTASIPCSGTYPSLSFAESAATVNFQFGPVNAANVVTGAGLGPITLPAGQFTELQMLGTGVGGTQAGQNIIVNYTDGSNSTISQTFGDWYSGHCTNAGESPALVTAYRITPSGGDDNRNFYICLYNIAINPSKTVSTLVLPNNRDVVIMAASLVAIPGFATAAGTPSAVTVTAGSSITVPASAVSEAGYNGTVSLACTVSPTIQSWQAATAPSCTFSPSSVSVAVGSPGTSTLTFAPAAAPKSAMANRNSRLMYALWLPIPGLALIGFGASSRTSRARRLLGLTQLALLVIGLLATPACVSTTHLGNVGTPPGQYTLIITGTDQTGNTQLGTGGSVTVTVQ